MTGEDIYHYEGPLVPNKSILDMHKDAIQSAKSRAERPEKGCQEYWKALQEEMRATVSCELPESTIARIRTLLEVSCGRYQTIKTMNDPRYTAIWISDDMKYSINFTKCATTHWCDDSRSTWEIEKSPEAKEPIFTIDLMMLYGATAISAFEFFKAFHQNIDHPL